MYWSSPLVAQAVTLGLVDPRRLSRLARRVCRNAGDLASCDVVWANELVAHGYLTRYQAQTLLWQVGPTDAPRPSRIASISTPLKIGPYLVQEHIASSDMGMTFRCRRSGQRGESAVKLLESQWTTEEGTRARIVAESAAWSELQLDGVMPLELVEQGQRLGLASPWLRAYPLESWVRAGRRLSPNGAIGFICRLIATLAAADARGLVHGDLKPSNVLVGVRGKVLLLDCGVRRGMAGAQVRIARNLSPDCYRYVAPEIASGECDPDVASDIYSLGCLLYHLICGQPPYSGANAERMGLAHRSGRPLAPHMLGIEMGRETQRLLGDCMQPDRSRRIGSYSELLSRVPPSVWKGGQAGSEIRRVGRRGGDSSRLLVRDPSGHRLGRAAKWIAVSVAILVAATAIGLSSWVPPLLRIGTARKSQPIAADNRRGPNPDRVMPGSVVSDLWNASEDLRRAYQNASPHDTITLQSPGPFLLDAIEIGKPITIRGALHVRPLFVGGPSASLRVIASGVRLENMHFMRLTGIERNESDGPTAGIVEALGSDLAMSHCSFQDIDLGQAASVSWRPAGGNLAEPPHLVLECVLFRDVGSGVSIHAEGGTEVLLRNCVHLGRGPLVKSRSGAGRSFEAVDLVLNRVTVHGASTVEHEFPHPLEQAVPLRIVAQESCLLTCRREQPLLAVRYAAQPAMLMPKVLWSGLRSVCPSDGTMLEVVRGPDATPWRAVDFAAWKKYWGTHSTGLLGSRLPFGTSPPEYLKDLPIAPSTESQRVGCDLTQMLVPPTLTAEQMSLLIERVGVRR